MTPINNNSIIALLRQELPALKAKYPIHSLALFGSYSRNEATETSDIDLLVNFTHQQVGYEYLDLYFELQTLFGNKKIDLVTEGAIPAPYWQYIKNDLQYV
ncbi:MAG: nucleotidyltransferase family protein [Chitinophagales bacterium]|jgi:predicted nucleotidyltransferase|nr:nucleotidyltransferase family protein [Chitinophagales bacterium]